jgi:hypothetical protein
MPQATTDATSAMTVMRRAARTQSATISFSGSCPPVSRLCRRSTTSVRMPAAPAAETSVNASSPSPPRRYHCTKPPVTALTASAWAFGPCFGSKTAAAAALRCTGPIVSCGRTGP